MEQLAFADPAPSSELDELVKEMDRRLDACFLGDLEDVFERIRAEDAQPAVA